MKGKDFLKIINDLDDELIEQADRTYKRKKPAILIISAACLAAAAIIITISLILIKDNNNDGLKTAENNIITEITIQTTSADEETRIIQSEVQMNNIDETTLQTTITESSQESEKITEVDGITENIVYEETTIYEETNDESDLSEVDTQAYYEEPDNNETGIAEYRVISIDQASNESDLEENEDSWELFWQDDHYNYYMHPGEAGMTFVYYENGEMEPLITALNLGHIDISDLDYYGVSYLKE